MIQNITHKHLRKELLNFGNVENLDNFICELEFSTLIVPTANDGSCYSYNFGDMMIIPLFTDIFEYEKVIHFQSLKPVAHEFNFYLGIIQDNPSNGFVINIESERFRLGEEILEIIKPRNTYDYKENQLTKTEIII